MNARKLEKAEGVEIISVTGGSGTCHQGRVKRKCGTFRRQLTALDPRREAR